MLIVVAAAVVLVVAGFWYWQRQHEPMPETPAPQTAPTQTPVAGNTPPKTMPVIREETPASTTTPSTTAPTADTTSQPAPPPIVQPPKQLDNSDTSVQNAVTQLDAQLPQWLMPEEQIRKWVMLVNQLADGKVPARNRPLEYPLTPFKVKQREGSLWLDPDDYHRADVLIKAITRIPPEMLARYYHAWEPLLQKAQDELGNDARFQDKLRQAIKRIEAVKPLDGEVKLEPVVITYRFVDPTLEQASALEKQMWRLGPDNTRLLQQYLRKLEPLL